MGEINACRPFATIYPLGMFTSQFVIGTDGLAKSPNPLQSYTVRASNQPENLAKIPLLLGTVTVVAENGPLVVRCPKCLAYSGVGVPTHGS